MQSSENKKRNAYGQNRYKIGAVFLEPRSDNSQSTVAGRDPDEPPLYYFKNFRTLKKAREKIDHGFLKGKIAYAEIRNQDTGELVAKWTLEKQWNHEC